MTPGCVNRQGLNAVFLALAAVLGGCSTLPATDAEGRALLAGNWYGEYACSACKDRDLLRWTRFNAADGSQRVHFRYYDRGQMRENAIRTGRWGYENGIYWLTCERYEVDGKPEPCPDTRYDFTVEFLNTERMTYYSEKYRIRYSARRVADDFRLTD